MSPSEFLQYELALLLLRYGKQSVLKGLAQRINLSEPQLDLELKRLQEISSNTADKKRRQTKPFSIHTFAQGAPEKAALLKELHARFENRTFLPELKDVKRFFDRHNKRAPSLKSRLAAQAPLFKALSELEPATLKALIADSPTSRDFSSLGLISDEILRRGKGE